MKNEEKNIIDIKFNSKGPRELRNINEINEKIKKSYNIFQVLSYFSRIIFDRLIIKSNAFSIKVTQFTSFCKQVSNN